MNSAVKIIYCIGDSHVDVFSGTNKIQPEWPKKATNLLPLFRTFRLGAVLAYNISKADHPTNKQLRQVLRSIPKKSCLMIVAGEIDCRVHIVKQAILQKKSIEKVAINCVNNYFKLLLQLKNKGFKVIAWGPLPATPYSVSDKEYPTNGSYLERTKATIAFNNRLQFLCAKNNIHFVSLFPELSINGKVKTWYFIDAIHASTLCLPFYYRQLERIDFIDKKYVENSKDIKSKDIYIEMIRRKLLFFLIIKFRFYKIAQKCINFIKKYQS